MSNQVQFVQYGEAGVQERKPFARPLVFNNIKAFVFAMAVLQLIVMCFSSGYLPPVLPTLEKRYNLSSFLSGIINSAFDISALALVILVSYFGSNQNIPRWIGIGTLVNVVGTALFFLPHFFFSQREDLISANGSSALYCPRVNSPADYEDCPINIDKNSAINDEALGMVMMLFVSARVLMGIGCTPYLTLGTAYIDSHVDKEKSGIYIAPIYAANALGPVFGFLLGGTCLNIYVNIHAPPGLSNQSPNWIGAWWIGFVIGTFLLLVDAIPFFFFPARMSPGVPSVLSDASCEGSGVGGSSGSGSGMGGMGGVNGSGAGLDAGTDRVSSELLPANESFNSTVTTTTTTTTTSSFPSPEAQSSGSHSQNMTLSDLPRDAWQMLTNPVFMLISLAATCEIAIVNSFTPFLAKYTMFQFFQTNARASQVTGGLAVGGAVLGVLLGGLITKKFAMTPYGAIRFCSATCLLILAGYTVLFVLGADSVLVAGVNAPYSPLEMHHFDDRLPNSADRSTSYQLRVSCNRHCQCSMQHTQLSCGSNGLTYISPCFAGCSSDDSEWTAVFSSEPLQTENFTCACIDFWYALNRSSKFSGSQMVSPAGRTAGPEPRLPSLIAADRVPLLTPGSCRPEYANTYFWAFTVIIVALCLLTGLNQMPVLLVSMRSVPEHLKSFSLGFQYLIMRVLAAIPAPIVVGLVIDSVCVVWNGQPTTSVASPAGCSAAVPEDQRGSCLIYDLKQLRLRFVGMMFGLKLFALIFYVACWISVRRGEVIDRQKRLGRFSAGDDARRLDDRPMSIGELLASVASVNSATLNVFKCSAAASHVPSWHKRHRRRHSDDLNLRLCKAKRPDTAFFYTDADADRDGLEARLVAANDHRAPLQRHQRQRSEILYPTHLNVDLRSRGFEAQCAHADVDAGGLGCAVDQGIDSQGHLARPQTNTATAHTDLV